MSLKQSYLFMVFAALIFGGQVFGGKLFEEAGVSFVELMIIPGFLLPIGLIFFLKKDIFKLTPLAVKYIAIYISTCFLICIGQYAPLYMGVSVSLTLLLMYTQPIWTMLFSHFFLKRKLQSYELFVFLLIVSGVYTLLGIGELTGSVLGIILALMAGIGLSAEVFCAEKLSQNHVSASVTYFWLFLMTAIPFLIIGLFLSDYNPDLFGLNMFNFTRLDLWGYMLIFTFISMWLGNFLMFRGFQKVPALHGGLILLLELVVGVILDITILKTSLTWNMILGGSMILTGNVFLIYYASRKKPIEQPVFEEV